MVSNSGKLCWNQNSIGYQKIHWGKDIQKGMQEKELAIGGGSLYYEIRQKEVHITRLQGIVSEIRIPELIEGLPVTEIEKKAFLSKKYLRRVFLPDTIVQVGDWAFAYCDNLEQVEVPCGDIRFGKAVFLDCIRFHSLTIRGKEPITAALLAAAVTTAEAYYLLDIREAGSGEWLSKWDARMLTIIHGSDQEGYSKQILCGEEDYGSTDLDAYMNRKRKEKVRLMLLRLLYPEGLSREVQGELQEYLQAHTKGCDSEETWQVILTEHGNDREYYQLFAELGCMGKDNFDAIITDIGEEYPEMKAYFMRYKEENIGYSDFFADLDL